MKRRAPLIVIACGLVFCIVCFLLALYGVAFEPGSWVPIAAGLGIPVLGFAGLVFLALTARFSRPGMATLIPIGLGVALHVYETLLNEFSMGSIGFLVWALIPYSVCLFGSALSATRIPSAAAAIVVLLLDLFIHYDVFVRPTSSTAALALLFAPLLSTFVIVPVVMLVTWLILWIKSAWGRKP